MRKVVVLAILLAFAMCTAAYAGGVGNCIKPLKTTTEFLGLGGAFEYNYVHERMNDLENDQGPKSMKLERINQVYGKVIMGLSDNFNLYGSIGGSNYDLSFVDKAQDALMEIDLENGIYTGAGVNALFPFFIENLWIGADMQSNFFYNEVKGITRSGHTASAISGSFYGVDGQNSVYLAYEVNIESISTLVIPYVGGYHSWALVGSAKSLTYETRPSGYVDKEDFQAAFDFASFGVLVGIDIDIAKYASFNIEGRFVGETAITTGATIKF